MWLKPSFPHPSQWAHTTARRVSQGIDIVGFSSWPLGKGLKPSDTLSDGDFVSQHLELEDMRIITLHIKFYAPTAQSQGLSPKLQASDAWRWESRAEPRKGLLSSLPSTGAVQQTTQENERKSFELHLLIRLEIPVLLTHPSRDSHTVHSEAPAAYFPRGETLLYVSRYSCSRCSFMLPKSRLFKASQISRTDHSLGLQVTIPT